MALPTTLNRSRSSLVFLKAETTSGTIADHPVAADRFDLTTAPVIGQAGNYTDTSEIGPELITTDRILNYMDYSSFDFEFYAKPQGVTDTAITANLTGTPASDNASPNSVITISYTSGNVPTGVAAGATLVNTSSKATLNGVFVVKAVSGDDVTFTAIGQQANSGMTNSGDFANLKLRTMSTNARGVIGPEEHEILLRCMGKAKYMSTAHNGYFQGDTNSATDGSQSASSSNGTAVQYSLSNTIQTLTVSSRQFTDDAVQMYTATGSLPTSFSISMAKEGPVTYSVGFQANRVYYSGTLELSVSSNTSVSHNSASDVKVISPKRHASNSLANASDVAWLAGSKGAKFTLKNNGSLVTSAAGSTTVFEVKVAPSDTGTTDILNIEPVANAPASGLTLTGSAFLIPFAPESSSDASAIIGQNKIQAFLTDQLTGSGLDFTTSANTEVFNSANELDITSVNFDFDRAITTPGLTEMTGEDYPPASYVINEPTITGSITLLLRPKDFQYMNSLRAEPHRALGIRIGDTAGKIIEFAAPSVFMEIPTPADLDGATSIDIPFTVVRGAEQQDSDKFFIRYR